MRFKIDWASLIVGSNFTVFALFYFVFEGNFPREACIWRGDLTEGFFCVTSLGGLYLEGLIFGILRYSEKSNIQEAYLPITSISGQNLIVSKIFKPSCALMTPYKSF